jgi:hypothetical protein
MQSMLMPIRPASWYFFDLGNHVLRRAMKWNRVWTFIKTKREAHNDLEWAVGELREIRSEGMDFAF